MGWSYGTILVDGKEKEVGYSVEAVCEHLGCKKEIDRGISSACGDWHGEADEGCASYFCWDHKNNWIERLDGTRVWVCDECAEAYVKCAREEAIADGRI